MTVRLISGSIKEFIGNSTDTKPTEGIKVGSTFYERDTTDYYIYDGASWNKKN